MKRYSLSEFHKIPVKDQSGRSTVFTVQRENSDTKVSLWPLPDNSTDTIEAMVYKKIEDVTASYQKVDVSSRYLPLLTKWLSYELSLKRPNVDANLRMELKSNYLEALEDVKGEDRERTDMIIKPGGISGRS
jgi:hypothetical protein